MKAPCPSTVTVTVEQPDQNRSFTCEIRYSFFRDGCGKQWLELDLLDVIEAVVYLDGRGYTLQQGEHSRELREYVERELVEELSAAAMEAWRAGE